jgi:hypothetical protein
VIQLVVSFLLAHACASDFPLSPDPSMTPGSLCARPTERRYPERIAYCTRSVGSDRKRAIMRAYDEELGYRVTSMDRGAFKIDHYIPLCMGGSNESDNLWPQHMSVYQYTDALEELTCRRMAEGRLSQADAVELIKRAKADPAGMAATITHQVQAL